MLFLLPPSESKIIGGGSLNIQQVALSFGGLNPARDRVFEALERLCQNPPKAAAVLKLGAKQLDLIDVNLAVQTAPTLPALKRYAGTLYGAIDADSLSQQQLKVAKETVLIQSALFGLIPATDLIPNYRLSAGTNLPGLNLRRVWEEVHVPIWKRLASHAVIDLRSKSYAQLAPIPGDIEHHWVEVVSRESGGSLKAMNHFNKKAKGQLIGAVLRSPKTVESIDELAAVAKSIGMELRPSSVAGELLLITDQVIG